MIASVVLDNLAYLLGAIILAVVLGLLMALRHRRPKSMEANVESFNRGLRALSPDATGRRGRGRAQPSPLVAPAPRANTAMSETGTVRPLPANPGRVEPEAGTG